MGKLQNHKNPESTSKILFKKNPGEREGGENGGPWKTGKTSKHHEINDSIHGIDTSLGAARLAAAKQYRRTSYIVRIRNERVPLGQQRQGTMHGNVPCLSVVATTF